MADLAAPVPGQFDAQAPGLTAASGTAPQKLEGEIQALEQQLADLQVMSETHCTGNPTIFGFLLIGIKSRNAVVSFVRSTFQACLFSLTAVHVTQIKVQQKRAEADPVAPYSRSFNRTLVGTLYAASGGLGLVSHLTSILHLHCIPVACLVDPSQKYLTHIVDTFK